MNEASSIRSHCAPNCGTKLPPYCKTDQRAGRAKERANNGADASPIHLSPNTTGKTT